MMKKKQEPCWLDDEGLSDGLFVALRELALLYQTKKDLILYVVENEKEFAKKTKGNRKEVVEWVKRKRLELPEQLRLKTRRQVEEEFFASIGKA